MALSSGKAKRRGVVICGAYGRGNAGDEAILEAIVLQMRSLDAEMPITVVSRRPTETAARLGVSAAHTFNIPAITRAMRSAALYINGGGSLIQDVTSRRSLWYYLFTLAEAKRLGCRVIMYGCGIGPVLYEGDRRLVRRVLDDNVEVITLRERHSLDELRSYGVSKPDILLTSDPALTLPSAPEGEVDAAMERFGLKPDGRYICFCLRRWPGFEEKAPIFGRAADYAYEKHGLEPVFLSINHVSDGDAAERAALNMSAPRHILREPMDSGLTIGLLSRMELAVSMRLHGLIFAAGHGVPLVGVAYDPKVTAFLSYAGQSLYSQFDALDAETLFALIDSAAALSGQRETLARNVRELRRRESGNLDAVRRLLGL